MQIPTVGYDEIEAVKNLSKDGRTKLAEEINATDPAKIFTDAKTPNDTTRKIICPLCSNGAGGDHTPVKVVWRTTFWHYKCYKCGELPESLLMIIAKQKNLTLSNFEDFCEALATGANMAGITVTESGDNSEQRQSQTRNTRPKLELTLADLPAQAPEYERLAEARLNLPTWFKSNGNIRGLTEQTLARLMWGILYDFKHPNPNDKTKFLALIIPNDKGGIFSREIQTLSNKNRRGYYRNINPTTTTTIVKPTADKPLFVVEGAIDGASIAQATNFEIGIIAIGGTSGGEQLLARLNELFPAGTPKPKVILMLDNDDTDPEKNSGQIAAAKLLPKIRQLGFVAVNRVIGEETRKDANKILVDDGQDALKNRIETIIADAQAEFATVEKSLAEKTSANNQLTEQLNEWQRANGAIEHSIMPELMDAVKFVDELKPETLSADLVQSQKLFHALAMCQFYGLSARTTKAYAVITEAKNNAKEALQLVKSGLSEAVGEDVHVWEQVTVSDIKRAVNKLITEYRKAHAKWLKQLEFTRRRNEEQAKIDARQLAAEDTLTKEQLEFLYSFDENEDYENAERLHYLFGDQIRYIEKDDQWLAFDKVKGLWLFGCGSKNTVLMPFARKMVKLLSDNAPNSFDVPDAKDVIKYWKSTKRTSLAFNYLKSNDTINITWDDLEKHRNLLKFRNGVVDLQTGLFYPNTKINPDWLITRQCNMYYDPAAKNQDILNFLTSIQPDPDTFQALIRLLGYLFTGETTQQFVWLWKGEGSNGKSTLINLILVAAADYATKLSTAAILESSRPSDANAATAALNPIIGKNIAFVNELKKNEFLNEPLVKDISGGDKLPLRPLNKEMRLVTSTAKLIINGNYYPRLRNPNENSIRRRIRTIEFPVEFSGDKVDPDLPKKLTTREALSAFGNIIVDAAMEFYKTGKLPESSEMISARKNYISDNDFIAEFLSESCTLRADAYIPAKDLYKALREQYPKETAPLRDKDLQRLILQEKSISYERHKTTRQQCFFNIGLVSDRATQAEIDNGGQELSPAEQPPF